MRKFACAAIATASLLALACSKTPAKLTVTPPKTSLVGKDATVTLKATVATSKDQALPEVPVTWSSSSEAVATVDAGGKVTPKASGEATITAKADKVSGTARVSVVLASAVQMALPETGLSGASGTKVQLAAKLLDEKGREHPEIALTYTSSDPKCAPVDKNGAVTLIASGPVTLTASAAKGVEGKLQADVLIQVPKFAKLLKPALALKVGESAPVEYEAYDEKGRPCKVPPAFASSDEKVAKVDALGRVTGVGPGTAEILLTVGADRRPVKVTVK